MSATSLDAFTRAYLECALWSSLIDAETEEYGDTNHLIEDLAPEALAQAVADCAKFQADNFEDIYRLEKEAGHDFWLTRNCHGAGFWDGDWPEDVGKRLTNAAHAFGELSPYVGDDGKVYL